MELDAVEDARAAIRFVRSQADDYLLDADRVSLWGASAGAVTALYLGYAANAQYSRPRRNLPEKSCFDRRRPHGISTAWPRRRRDPPPRKASPR